MHFISFMLSHKWKSKQNSKLSKDFSYGGRQLRVQSHHKIMIIGIGVDNTQKNGEKGWLFFLIFSIALTN